MTRSYSAIAREYSPADQRRLLDFTLRTNELLNIRTEQLRDD